MRAYAVRHPWGGPNQPPPRPRPPRVCRDCGGTEAEDRPFAPRRRFCVPCFASRQADYHRDHRAQINERRRTEAWRAKMRARARRERHQRWRARGLSDAPRRWWSLQRVATEVGLSKVRAWELVREGRLAGMRDAANCGEWRVDPASVGAYLRGEG